MAPPGTAPRMPNCERYEGSTSASGDSCFSFFLSGWKDGVPQGRHRLYRHLVGFHHRRGRERQRKGRLWRFGREASADRWLGEWSSVSTGPRGERTSQPGPARRSSSGIGGTGSRCSPNTRLFGLHFLFKRHDSLLCLLRGELGAEKRVKDLGLCDR